LTSLFNPIDILNDSINDIAKNIKNYCQNPGKDFTRSRKLPVERLIKLILESEGNSIDAELFKSFPDANERMTASAFVQQRGKLKHEAFRDILRSLDGYMDNTKRFKGYRILAIDGTDLYFPANPDSKCFVKRYRKRNDGTEMKNYCLLHANILYDVLNKQYLDCLSVPKGGEGGNERKYAAIFIDNYEADDVIMVMDRGYTSYNIIKHCERANKYFICRSITGKGAFKEIEELDNVVTDNWVNIKITTVPKKKYLDNGYKLLQVIKKHYKNQSLFDSKRMNTASRRQWDFEEACTITYRILKFQLDNGNWEVLITNLPNSFTMEEIKKIYGMRWGIETSFRDLKYAVGAIQFHSKQDEFVKQELYAHLVMYNVISACGNNIEIPNKDLKYNYAIDFKMAVHVVRSFFRKGIDSFIELNKELSRYLQPVRPNRSDLRKVQPRSPVFFIYRVA